MIVRVCIECGHLPTYHKPKCTWKDCTCNGLLVYVTKKELIILKEVAKGKSSKEIATLLGMAPKTVDVHRANVMQKLRLHKAIEVFIFVLKNRLITIDDLPEPPYARLKG